MIDREPFQVNEEIRHKKNRLLTTKKLRDYLEDAKEGTTKYAVFEDLTDLVGAKSELEIFKKNYDPNNIDSIAAFHGAVIKVQLVENRIGTNKRNSDYDDANSVLHSLIMGKLYGHYFQIEGTELKALSQLKTALDHMLVKLKRED